MENYVDVATVKDYEFIDFTNRINNLDVHFVSHIQIKEKHDVTNLYNYLFYVPTTSDVYEKFVRSFYENGFVNAIPVFDNSLLNRSKTYVSFNLDVLTLETIIMDLKGTAETYEQEHKNFNSINKFVFDSFIELLERINKDNAKDIVGKIIFIDFRNTLFNLHGIELRRGDSLRNSTPIISSYNVAEFLKGDDIKLNFSDNGTGIYSASLSPEMFTVEGLLFRPVVGSHIRLDKNGLAASYMGSIFTPEDFENYTKLRVLLELEFKPKYSESMFGNTDDFEDFNKFINNCKDVKATTYRLLNLKAVSLSRMTLEIEGSDAETLDKEKLAKMILFSFIKSVGRLELVSNVDKLDSYFKENFTFNAGEHTNDKLVVKTNDPTHYNDLSFDILGW